MRIVFMGTPSFAAEHLKALVSSSYEIVGVFTQQDKPRGRGQTLKPTSVKQMATSLGLAVYQPSRVNSSESVSLVESLRPDVIITVAFGKILRQTLLGIPPLGCYNVHASLLPRFRGAAPIQHALMRGEKRTGVTIFKMDEGMDSGPIALSEELLIGEFETFGSLSERLSSLGVKCLVEFMSLLSSGQLELKPQEDSQATYAPKITEKDREISEFNEARRICNIIRAFDPIPGAFSQLTQERIRLFGARTVEETTGGLPGEISSITSKGMSVSCESGVLLVEKLQLAGRRIMSPWEARSGRLIREGIRLGGY